MTRDPTRSTQTLERTETTRPRLFRVLLLNDDYTPMDFVVMVLTHYFRQSEAHATAVMLSVHQRGSGVAGVYTREIAETKAAQVIGHARAEGHPLELSIEPEAEQ
ncbi:ATP-dependent Clp protease adapter ClpS [Deinococcus sp.]|uniref:ATP-dependent Clp protease adapter ClpS n=1 Tax=Deinococcus sp. TaxID=47478 RepID=UPI003CC575B0